MPFTLGMVIVENGPCHVVHYSKRHLFDEEEDLCLDESVCETNTQVSSIDALERHLRINCVACAYLLSGTYLVR